MSWIIECQKACILLLENLRKWKRNQGSKIDLIGKEFNLLFMIE